MSKENRKGGKQKNGSSRKNYFASRKRTAKQGSKGKSRYAAFLSKHK